jgi:hypothetical protein
MSGITQIPFSEFFIYAWAYGYRGDELTDLWEIFHLIDITFVSEFSKQKQDK